MSAPKWAAGMQMIGPGIYAKDKQIHLDMGSIAAALQVPLTPEFEAMIHEVVVEAINTVYGGQPGFQGVELIKEFTQ